MTGTGVAVVIELLFDVDHVAAGVFQLSELSSATEISEVAELGQPRPGWSVCGGTGARVNRQESQVRRRPELL